MLDFRLNEHERNHIAGQKVMAECKSICIEFPKQFRSYSHGLPRHSLLHKTEKMFISLQLHQVHSTEKRARLAP